MRFLDNPYILGIEYHSSGEIHKEDGSTEVRYVLSKVLTQEQLEKIRRYDNVRYVPNGATYRYSPEIKYPVLYVSYTADEWGDGDEEAEESFEEIQSENLDEDSVMSQLNSEIEGDDQIRKFNSLTGAINMANSLASFYNQLKAEFPQHSDIFDSMIAVEVENTGKLQSILNEDPNIGNNFTKGLEGEVQEEIPVEEAIEVNQSSIFPIDGYSKESAARLLTEDEEEYRLRLAVFNRIESSQSISTDLKKNLVEEIMYESIYEFTGVEEDQIGTLSDGEITRLADEYVKSFEGGE